MTVAKESTISRYIGLSSDVKPTGATVPKGSTFREYDTNDTYITPDQTNWVIQDSKSVKRFKVLTVLAATGAYASGDILSNSEVASSAITWNFNAVAGCNGGGGKIVQAQVETTEDTPSATLTMYLFTATPTCVLTDNVAGALPLATDVSTGIYLGKIDFPAFSVWGVANANSMLYAAASCMPFYFTTSSGADDLKGVLITSTGATFASKELAITLWVKRD
jgi:hypothetical protein